jgi:hypothetical protein
MSMKVLVEEIIITNTNTTNTNTNNSYSAVIFARSNLSNSIFGHKNGANFVQIGRIRFKWAEFHILNSKFQQKQLLFREKSNNS